MGGSCEWKPGYRMEDICANLVPLEIALKIAEKIRSGQAFAAYIVLPLWPEGALPPGLRRSMRADMLHRLCGAAVRCTRHCLMAAVRARRQPHEWHIAGDPGMADENHEGSISHHSRGG